MVIPGATGWFQLTHTQKKKMCDCDIKYREIDFMIFFWFKRKKNNNKQLTLGQRCRKVHAEMFILPTSALNEPKKGV